MAEPYIPYSGPIVTRDQARTEGLSKFFTGALCREGHLFQRSTGTGSCIRCFYEKRLLRRPLRPVIPLVSDLELLLQRTMPEPNSGCWFWMGTIATNGYGRVHNFRARGKYLAAHRVIYELIRGPVSATLDLDHLCRVRSCVNPNHLEPVTRQVNARRGMCGALTKARYEAMEFCRKGHPRSAENLYRRPDGRGTGCRMCLRVASAKYRGKQ
jgi:hypothetical protein